MFLRFIELEDLFQIKAEIWKAHFLYQEKAECYFYNGTQRVRHLYRSFYDRQEIDYFDSDLGKYVAVTPLAQPDVDKWNRDEQWLQYNKASVDSFCRHNYEVNSYEAPKREERAIGRRSESWGLFFLGGEAGTPFLSWPSLEILLPGDGSASFFLLPLRAPESPASPQDPNSPPVRDLGSL
ncbi:putative MHC class II antigen protein [Naja naja]|nr:putative MHC class II antigen protein [Naja naja]